MSSFNPTNEADCQQALEAALAADPAKLEKMRRDRASFLQAWFNHVPDHSCMALTTEHVEYPYPWVKRTPLWVERLSAAVYKPKHGEGLDAFTRAPVRGAMLCPQPVHYPGGERSFFNSNHVASKWWFVGLDIDLKDVLAAGKSVKRVLRDIERHPGVPPWWAWVESGSGGVHLWWALEGGAHRSEVLSVQHALARMFMGDLGNATGLRPSLRLPGTVNPKYGKHSDLLTVNLRALTLKTCVIGDFRLPRAVEWQRPVRTSEHVHQWVYDTIDKVEGVQMLHSVHGSGGGWQTVLSKCPRCNGARKASIFHDAPRYRISCKSAGCRPPSVSKLADDLRVAVPLEDMVEHRETIPLGFARNQATEAVLIRKSFDAWAADARDAEILKQPVIHVVQSGAGMGKDHTLVPAYAEVWGKGMRDIKTYAPRFADLERKVKEGLGDLKARIDCSPISLTDEDGVGCREPSRLPLYTSNGFSASFGCLGCPQSSKEGGGCELWKGYKVLGEGDEAAAIPFAATSRAVYTEDMTELKGAIIDEGLEEHLVLEATYTVEQLTAFRLYCLCPYTARAAGEEIPEDLQPRPGFAEWVTAIEEALSNLPEESAGASFVDLAGLVEDFRWGSELDVPGEAPRARLVFNDDGSVAFPGSIGRDLERLWAVASGGQSIFDSGVAVFGSASRLSLWRNGLSALPPSTLISDASWPFYAPVVEQWAERKGVIIKASGGQMRRYTRDIYVRTPYASRGPASDGSPRVFRTGTNGTGGKPVYTEHLMKVMYDLKQRLIEHAEMYDVEVSSLRVLFVTYKDACLELTDVDTGCLSPRWVGYLGCSPKSEATWYKRARGDNRWSGFECIVCYGDPNPAFPTEKAAATAELYGNLSFDMMRRLGESSLTQAFARARAKREEDADVDSPRTLLVSYTTQPPMCFGTGFEHAALIPRNGRYHLKKHLEELMVQWNFGSVYILQRLLSYVEDEEGEGHCSRLKAMLPHCRVPHSTHVIDTMVAGEVEQTLSHAQEFIEAALAIHAASHKHAAEDEKFWIKDQRTIRNLVLKVARQSGWSHFEKADPRTGGQKRAFWAEREQVFRLDALVRVIDFLDAVLGEPYRLRDTAHKNDWADVDNGLMPIAEYVQKYVRL